MKIAPNLSEDAQRSRQPPPLAWLVVAAMCLVIAWQSTPHSTGAGTVALTENLAQTPSATPTPSTDPSDFTSKGALQFAPVTIADFSPLTTNAPLPDSLTISGDWVVYGVGHIVCGHCGSATDTIYAQNVITGKLVTIHSSTQGTLSSIAATTDIELHGTVITWKQPANPQGQTPTPGISPEKFKAGDFDCGDCYYDLVAEQGGTWSGGSLPSNPPADWAVTTSPEGTTVQGEQVITVTQKSTGQLAFAVTFIGFWTAESVAFTTDKMVYLQTQFGEGAPRLARVVWLLPGDPAFTNVWTKADGPVASGKAARSWLWGPGPLLTRQEEYIEGKNGRRLVQYYDKSRMEINNPDAAPGSPGYITNGLLTVEMISGEIQIGNMATVTASVQCTIPVAGDPRKDNPLTPSYATLASVASVHSEHQAPNRAGQPVDDTIDINGVVKKDSAHASLARYATFVPQTGHNIPNLFWAYLTGMEATYGFDWTFVLGYPITEAYWTQMRIGGKDYPVLIQAYQRRVLTYTPAFAPEWRVQQGNVGQHYLEWRTTALGLNKLPNIDISP